MTIDVYNYDTTQFVPRGIVNLVEGCRLPSAADEPRKVCLIGVGSFPAGSAATRDRPVRVLSEKPSQNGASGASATELFGSGCELHLMCRAAFRAYPGVELWGVPLAEPAGSMAEASLTAAGTSVRVGEWTIVVHGAPVPVRVETNSDPRETLIAIASALNVRDDLPIGKIDLGGGEGASSSSSSGGGTGDLVPGSVAGTWKLLLHARHSGENGNFIDLFRRGGVAGQSLTVTRFGGGVGENDLENALAEIEAERFHHIAVANTDPDNLGRLREHLWQLAQPKNGLRQQALFGWVGSLEDDIDSAAAIAEGLNSPRMQCVWSKGSAFPPGELAAAVAAHRSWMEGSFSGVNLSGQIVAGLPRPRLPGDLPSHTDLNRALHRGVTPLDVRGTQMQLVRSVTTRAQDDSGGESYALLDTIKVAVSDFLADDIALKLATRFESFKLAPDTDVPIPAKTATPMTIRKSLIEWLRLYEAQGMVRQVAEHLDEIKVEIDPGVDGRINFELPEAVVDICAVTAGNLIRF